MRILLDTHLLLWWMEDDPRLSRSARRLVSEPENTVFVSAVSMWEIWLKQSLGKLELPLNFEDAISGGQFENLPLSAAHTREVANLPWIHRDPFDRMLVAQARVSRLRLLTADETVASYGDAVILAK